jgi:hypothetical protein
MAFTGHPRSLNFRLIRSSSVIEKNMMTDG